jgi:hypothetical protein
MMIINYNTDLYIMLLAIYITIGGGLKIIMGLMRTERNINYTIGDSIDGLIIVLIFVIGLLF